MHLSSPPFRLFKTTQSQFRLTLGQREGVPQVQPAVHVGVGEGDDVGLLGVGAALGAVLLEGLARVPLDLHAALDVLQELHLERALAGLRGGGGGGRGRHRLGDLGGARPAVSWIEKQNQRRLLQID